MTITQLSVALTGLGRWTHCELMRLRLRIERCDRYLEIQPYTQNRQNIFHTYSYIVIHFEVVGIILQLYPTTAGLSLWKTLMCFSKVGFVSCKFGRICQFTQSLKLQRSLFMIEINNHFQTQTQTFPKILHWIKNFIHTHFIMSQMSVSDSCAVFTLLSPAESVFVM